MQTWKFESESVIRIGRSTDNEVVLYSSVVSRHHVELRYEASSWEVFSLGANGTYLDDLPITKIRAFDGLVIRIASSGPRIQIRLDSNEVSKASKQDVSDRPTSIIQPVGKRQTLLGSRPEL